VAHLFEVTHNIGAALQRAFEPARVGVIIAGFEVPHAHIHVVPTNDMSQLDFANAAASVDRFALEAAASEIRDALRAHGHEDHVVD
jgi:diadenosine tetraphosphate (Ap4A) HIT family hydrolase